MNRFCLACIFITGSFQLAAQQVYFQSHTSEIYSRITAGQHPPSRKDRQLSGPVKTVEERVQTVHGKDTINKLLSFSHYSPKGLLTTFINGDSADYYNYFRIEYKFAGDRLQEVITTSKESIETLRYGSAGYLEEEQYRHNSDRTLNFTATYSYSSRYDTVKIQYNYETASSHWDRREDETHIFSFDKRGNLVRANHIDTEGYGGTLTLTYDSLDRVTAQHYLSSCYGSNSCVQAWVSYNYDERGNIIEEIATDATIRNSMWCYCYHYTAKYDMHNNLIGQTWSGGRESISHGMENKNQPSTEPGTRVTYVYDNHGNWIRKNEFRGEVPQSKIKRTIYYY